MKKEKLKKGDIVELRGLMTLAGIVKKVRKDGYVDLYYPDFEDSFNKKYGEAKIEEVHKLDNHDCKYHLKLCISPPDEYNGDILEVNGFFKCKLCGKIFEINKVSRKTRKNK